MYMCVLNVCGVCVWFHVCLGGVYVGGCVYQVKYQWECVWYVRYVCVSEVCVCGVRACGINGCVSVWL